MRKLLIMLFAILAATKTNAQNSPIVKTAQASDGSYVTTITLGSTQVVVSIKSPDSVKVGLGETEVVTNLRMKDTTNNSSIYQFITFENAKKKGWNMVVINKDGEITFHDTERKTTRYTYGLVTPDGDFKMKKKKG